MAGPSLKERFEAGPLAANELRALGIQIARALAAAHAAGIVHRDVKPANILVAGPSAWKLADFGVAHVPDSSLTMTGQFIGSPAYAPPEALVRGQSTEAGDVFGLGATLYYGAAGRWPRADATTSGLLAPVPSVRTLAPDLPEDLIATIDHAVEIEPDRRPTAAELADALAGATSYIPGHSPRHVPACAASQTIETVFVPDATSAGTYPRAQTPPPVETSFVPDATRDGSPVAHATAFVPDATQGAPARIATPARRARWQAWAIGAGVLALVVVIAVSSHRSRPAGADATRDAGAAVGAPGSSAVQGALPDVEPVPDQGSEDPAPEDPIDQPPPGQIRARTPRITDRRAADDWARVVEQLYNHKFDKARKKLVEWEQRWGETVETRSLRQQLDALPRPAADDD
jgi:hypothetical protein